MSPQADYIVANGTGASVRSDLNGQLAAIVSNNSGTTEPATMYAYQWWADTTAGLLKIRNAANNAWVTVGTLADANLGLLGSGSTIVAALGDASTPGITFTGDLNTGIFSPGADQVAVATNGTARLYIASDGKAGIGTTSPLGRLDSSWGGYTTGSAPALMIGADIGNTTSRTSSTRKMGLISGPHYDNGTDIGFIRFDSASTVTELQLGGTAEKRGATNISFYTATTNTATPSESARIDSSGRLLVGTSTSVSVLGENKVQLFGENLGGSLSLTRTGATTQSANLVFGRTRGDASTRVSLNNDDVVGRIYFVGDDGTDIQTPAALIQVNVDGTPGANVMPGRIVLSTTAAGASSPTERMRITNAGYIKQTVTGSYYGPNASYTEFNNTATTEPTILIFHASVSNTREEYLGGTYRSASSAQDSLCLYSGNGATNPFSDIEFRLRSDGNGYADGTWTGGGADYAEFFEWSDSNLNEEDRRGISVVLEGNKIREAVTGEEPIGVISGNPSVVGDAAWNKWSEMYLRDDYGTYVWEDHSVVEWVDEDGKRHSYEDWSVPAGIVVPSNATTLVYDANGKKFQHRVLNPAYDPDQVYISREERSEWDCVGLIGKLRIRKGQVTGSRWIKMRDINDFVEEWLVR
jgi:hypothetical protein